MAVVGAGSFGRNHLRVWRQMESAGLSVRLVALVEPDAVRSSALAGEYGIPAYTSVAQLLLAQPLLHAASIAVPTVVHFNVATELLLAGVDVLVEKPFTATLEQADALMHLLGRKIASSRLDIWGALIPLFMRLARCSTIHSFLRRIGSVFLRLALWMWT